ncbi:RDD family protein [Luteibacter aegosomatissinici]|uniref:RDD family protein n=1 Tax=Luteibacter aegosomatissinici TaxID=2911539 RepID=UPI001FFA070A|nr:RDD family protein [Luteibacter aegosomatissinici]UPG93684.1 RDD family protein [Luteibacter aegosomatissinici]
MSTPTLPAPAWRRFAAIVYDVLAVVAIVMVVGLIAQMATGGHVADDKGHIVAWWYQPLQALVVAAYFLFSWTRGGQTLGMRPWRIRVVTREGNAVDLKRALVRVVVAGLPVLLLMLYAVTSLQVALWAPLIGWAVILLPSLFDARRRGLHDMAAGTEIRPLAT